MKSKQELIEKWESAIEAAEFYGKGKEDRLIEYMRDFVDDLNQLDEPILTDDLLEDAQEVLLQTKVFQYEGNWYKVIKATDEAEVLSQEWIDEHKIRIDNWNEAVLIDDLEKILVPKQELPVIPNYIADFLNERKDWALFEIFDDVYLHNEHPRVNEWLYGDGIEVPQGREIKMVMALKFGYKLEPEQKYYIRDQHGVYLLAKNHREQGNVQTVAEIVEYYGVEEIELDYELTEEEIKGYDPRYMTFAKPIEELEE